MGLVFCFLFYEQCKGTLRLLNFGLMGVIGITIARTGSRGTLIGLAVALAGLFFVVKSVSIIQKVMTAGVLALGLALAAPAGYWAQMLTMFAPSNDYNVTSSTGRVEVWKRGLGYFASNPATGLGINNFGRAEGLISDRAVAWASDHSEEGVKWSAAHNSFIQILAEEGLPGFLLFAYLVFGGVWQMYKLQKRLPKTWEKGDAEERFLFAMPRYLPIVLLTFAASGSLVSFAYLDPMYLIAALMTGLYHSIEVKLAAQAAAPTGPAASAPPPPRRNERGGWGRVPATTMRPSQVFTPPLP